MSFLRSLKYFFSRSSGSNGSDVFQGARSNTSRDFSADYSTATQIIMGRIDAKFPDNYQVGFSADRDHGRDYGDDRAAAIDTASAAIAAALREGATVRQAADAGAKSIGI